MPAIKSQSGYSLIEILTALGISGVLLVTAMNLFVSTSVQSNLFVKNLEFEVEQLQASSLLRTVLGHAIELKYYSGATFNPTALNNYKGSAGQIRDFDSNNFWLQSPGTHTLAVFWREGRMSTSTSPSSLVTNLRPTGIYFQKPTRTTWGVLYIDTGINGTALEPTASAQFFEGLVRARVLNISVYREDPTANAWQAPVTSVEFELTFRRFMGDSVNNVRNYCPSDFFATDPACGDIGPHRDVIRNYKMVIKNNIVSRSLSGPRGARLFDQIYFLAPYRPASMR